jgi:transcriptional regulator with XRE-family HTH domain
MPSALGCILREARIRAGLHQSSVAERMNTARSTIARWELGTNEPSITQLIAICGVLSISPAQVIRDICYKQA